MKNIYLLASILGFVLPYALFLSWLSEHGFDIALFFDEIFSSKLSLFAWADVFISALVLIAFIIYDGKRLSMQKLWLPIVATLSVGVSFGLPLFLYMKEIHTSKI
ncbi:DUF2834 domain-containing protein [Sulfurimonas sp.]|uniref:DUF2834 domain-containing protein n=1 Tax=Sulfurimonas sp. TaxID=2022749 RepID=UPI003D123BDB